MRSGLLLMCLALLMTTGCSRDPRDQRSGVEELYERGTKSMMSGNFRNAIAYYEGLEARYPFSNQAKQAQLNLIFSYYKQRRSANWPLDAATTVRARTPDAPARRLCALYMRGLANFAPEHNWFHRVLQRRTVEDARRSTHASPLLGILRGCVQRLSGEPSMRPDAHGNGWYSCAIGWHRHENYVAEYYFKRGAFVGGG